MFSLFQKDPFFPDDFVSTPIFYHLIFQDNSILICFYPYQNQFIDAYIAPVLHQGFHDKDATRAVKCYSKGTFAAYDVPKERQSGSVGARYMYAKIGLRELEQSCMKNSKMQLKKQFQMYRYRELRDICTHLLCICELCMPV